MTSPQRSEFVLTRVFDALRELVFKAWTEAERLTQWWGPKGFTMQTAQLDLRPGGVFHYYMRSPEGREPLEVLEEQLMTRSKLLSVRLTP